MIKQLLFVINNIYQKIRILWINFILMSAIAKLFIPN